MKYRPHRRLLDESMAEMAEVSGRHGLVAHLRKEFERWPSLDNFDDKALHIDPYCAGDPRIGWNDVWIITLDGYGVVGFCDGPAL